jgi:hypothetical protein
MKIVGRGTVFAGERGTDRQSCAFAGIAVLPGGRWICGFRAAPTKSGTCGQHVLVTWSDDQGRSWSTPIRPFEPPPIVDGKPGLFRAGHPTPLGGERVLMTLYWVDHSDPSLAFFNEETEGLLDSRVFLAQSLDNGATWSAPALIDASPFNVPTPITGPVIVLPNGQWALQFELNKHYYDTSAWRHCAVLMFSSDEGKSWPEHVITGHDPATRFFYWDQRPSVLADGVLLDLFWTYDNHLATYLNIHARQSGDNGRTWSEFWDTGVLGQPGPPASLPDGRIAMVYVDRTAAPAIKLRTSADHGRTWPDETELTLYQAQIPPQDGSKASMRDAWAEMAKFSVGLPTTTPLPDGGVLVVYYEGAETDLTNIEWTRVQP